MTVFLQRTLDGYRSRVLGASRDIFVSQFRVCKVSFHSEQISIVLNSPLTTSLQRSSGETRMSIHLTIVPTQLLRQGTTLRFLDGRADRFREDAFASINHCFYVFWSPWRQFQLD